MKSYCLLLILCFSVYLSHAQCSVLAEKPLTGLGISAVFAKLDTVVVKAKWKAHEVDKILSYQKAPKGARSANISVVRNDGHIQGIYADKDMAYFYSADSVGDLRAKKNSYIQRPLRKIWYLNPQDSIADDESYLFILALHLREAWPIKTHVSLEPTVTRRVYAQGGSDEEWMANAYLYLAETCGADKKTRKTSSRFCDDGITYTGILEFECADKGR
jgi:hypothetical protein